MRFALTTFLALLAILSTACGNVVTTQQLIDAQKQQLEEDVVLSHLIDEHYQPIELKTREGKDPQILLVHCDGSCDKAPYSRDFPAVRIDIEKMPKVDEVESVVITSVTLITRRHALDDERTTQRSCTESLIYLPTLQELREIIGKLVDEDGDIVVGARITDQNDLESWKCDYN